MNLEIDLNSRTPDGLVPTHVPPGTTVHVGQQVTAYEPEDAVAAPAVVRAVEHGHAFLEVEWAAMQDWQP